ncbi:Ig-like domain-containing protein [Pediococcus sp. AC40]|jgi:hypothetical protein|uniref:Ig-like domain-containing protein n=1 Tax=Pediococcus sp. AC40 TaxID=2962679 RepID=UPI00254A2C77|nr:Ig-like domain-containing protein [Pediococcus sp. AC40]
MSTDRAHQHLVIFDKTGVKKFEGDIGKKTVAITGIEPGTSVANGEYQVAWSDGTSLSRKVDVPGFTVIVPVTGITLTKSELSMTVGDQTYIGAVISPPNATNQKIACSSTDEAVATFDYTGLVVAKGVGKSTIKATTVDGGYSAECVVTVTEK